MARHGLVGLPNSAEQVQADMTNATGALLSAGQPVCLDVSQTAGATAPDGTLIASQDAVGAFMATPAAANQAFFRGILREECAAGVSKPVVLDGTVQARVRNTTASSITLAVGTLLVQVPGQNYFVPLYQAVAAGGSVALSNHAPNAHAMVRKSTAIAASTTALVEVWCFAPTAPRPETLSYSLAGVNTTNLTIPLGIARGPGRIVRAGFGLEVCGTAGTATLDVLKNGTSIFTTAPVIANDGTDGVHTLKDTAAAAVGTGGSFGTLKTDGTANVVAGDKIVGTVTYASSPAAQAGLNVQGELLYD